MIAFIQKYFWIILVAVAFLLGILLSPGNDKELREQFEKEREEIRKTIAEKEKQIEVLTKKEEQIRNRMSEDSARFARAIWNKEITIHTLENEIKASNYRNARVRDLDSLRRILISSRH